MSHVTHLTRRKEYLHARFAIIRALREFFWSRGFIEVETPLIVALPGQEPNLSPMELAVHDERGTAHTAYLHTSPEYTMKKMLAAGMGDIFYLGKCFRDYESFGGLHSPEFTMLEWYRANADFWVLMDDVERLCDHIYECIHSVIASEAKQSTEEIAASFTTFTPRNDGFKRIHMRELWHEYVGVNLDDYLEAEQLRELCRERGHNAAAEESYETLFYRIFLSDIEPALKERGAIIVHHYPAKMASLARLSDSDPRYAERFELYIDGIEIANAFSELTDAREQLRRLQAEQKERARLGKSVYKIDMEFIEALRTMPRAAGIALGVDRLVQVLLGAQGIEDVLPLPPADLARTSVQG